MASLLQLPDSATSFTTTPLQDDASMFGSSGSSQITLGVITGLVSTCIQSVGLTLQRKSHMLEEKKPAHLVRKPFRRRKWQIGFTLFLLSNIVGSSVQITVLPLVILSSLQASGLVFNSICATLVLKEPFTNHSLAGTVLVVVGAGVIAWYGAMKDPAHSIDELLQLFGKRNFVIWMILQGVLVLGILLAAKLSVYLRPRLKNTAKMKAFRGVIYGSVSGILSADSLLLAKCMVELLVRTLINHQNQFKRYETWLILIGFLTLALTQLYYLNRGLRLVSTSLLYPLCFCLYNITAICDGIFYYNYSLPALHIALIAVGTAILLGGVLLLSWRLSDENATTNPPRPPFPTGLSKNKTTTTTTSEATEETALLSPTFPPLTPIPDDEESQVRPRRRTLGGRSSSSRKSSYNTIPLLRTPSIVPDEDLDDVEEIWDELEEDSRPLLDRAVTSPRVYRRVVSSGGLRYTRVNAPPGGGERLERSVTQVGDGILTGEATVAPAVTQSEGGGVGQGRGNLRGNRRSRSVGTVHFLDGTGSTSSSDVDSGLGVLGTDAESSTTTATEAMGRKR